jgi:hypothetical protein
MQREDRRLIAFMLIGIMLMVSTITIKASSEGGHFNIDWYSMDGGGTMGVTGGTYELSGTIAQVDTAVSATGPYEIQAGFWAGASGAGGGSVGPYQIYLPFVQKP